MRCCNSLNVRFLHLILAMMRQIAFTLILLCFFGYTGQLSAVPAETDVYDFAAQIQDPHVIPHVGFTGTAPEIRKGNRTTTDDKRVVTTFGFNLGANCYTSAGIYNANNELVRTLWRRVYYLSGKYCNFPWDGTDDDGHLLPIGNYTIKVLCNDVTYAWDGVIGNTSSSFSNFHRGTNSDNVLDLAFDGGQYIYEAFGYNEGDYDIRRFNINRPQVPAHVIHNNYCTNYGLVATDGTTLYLANVGNPPDVTHTTFIIAYKNNDFSQTLFPAYGRTATLVQTNGDATTFHDCIDIHSSGTKGNAYPRATGLAVQRAGGAPFRSDGGTILAVAHGDTVQMIDKTPQTVLGSDRIYLYEKTSGKAVGSIHITNPQRIAFDPRTGDLWILSIARTGINAGTITKMASSNFNDLGQVHTPKKQIDAGVAVVTGLSQPLAINVSPDGTTVLVADGGASQQIKAFSTQNGELLWSYGQPGGYSTSPTVTNDKFHFGEGVGLTSTTSAGGAFDGFWVGDGGCHHGGTNRILNVSSTRAFRQGIGCLSYSNTVAVVPDDPTRIFWNLLEFKVDYSKPLLPGNANHSWTMVNNWAAGTRAPLFNGGPHSFFSHDKHLYGLVVPTITSGSNGDELDEFPSDGVMRYTGKSFQSQYSNSGDQNVAFSLFSNGDLRSSKVDAKGNQTFYRQTISKTLDAHHNPSWAHPVVLATAVASAKNPQTQKGNPFASQWQLPITASNDIVVFDQDRLSTGWHLGGVPIGGNHFRWRASPTVTSDVPMDGLGSFDVGDGVTYAGNKVVAEGHNIFYGYHGEFWNQREASQYMHFYDDGLFVGQFGTTGDIYSPLSPTPSTDSAIPGFAGNSYNPAIARNGDDVYYYTNDEHEHGGINRWHILGLDAINEMSATIPMGGNGTLTAGRVLCPENVRAFASTNSVELEWSPMSNANSYRVKWVEGNPVAGLPHWPTGKGGPYTNVMNVTSNNCVVPGLRNDNRYYFVVSAVNDQGIESPSSCEVHATPLDTVIPVHFAGQLALWENLELLRVSSNTTFNGDYRGPGTSAVQLHPMAETLGTLHSINFGSRGFVILNYKGTGQTFSRSGRSTIQMVPKTSGVTLDWMNINQYLSSTFSMDGLPPIKPASALHGAEYPGSSISISTTNSSWHLLTVVCSAIFADKRYFTVDLSGGHPAVHSVFTVDSDVAGCTQGYNQIVQYAFRGQGAGDENKMILNVMQTANKPTRNSANLSAIFLDDYLVK